MKRYELHTFIDNEQIHVQFTCIKRSNAFWNDDIEIEILSIKDSTNKSMDLEEAMEDDELISLIQCEARDFLEDMNEEDENNDEEESDDHLNNEVKEMEDFYESDFIESLKE